MDSESEDLFFQKLQELVLDDDKIVTIPYLAKTLKISVQNSKYLIDKYVKDQRKLRPEELGIVYVLTGHLKNGRGKAVLMVKETDLKEKREEFDQLLNEVVFSIQKSKNIDFNIVSLVDQFELTNRENPLEGLIVGKNCTKRVLKFKKLPPLPPSTLKGKSSFFVPKSEGTKSSEKVSDSSKSISKPKSTNGIATMFNNAVSKETEKKPIKETKPLPKAKGGISNFFTKSTTKSSNGTKSENSSDKENGTMSVEFNSEQSIKLEDLTSFMEVDVEESSEDMIKAVAKAEEETPKKKESKEQKKSSKRQRETSAGKSTKKRKRIVQRDDSESDDMFEDEPNEEDIIEKSDEDPERVPSPIAEKVFPPKNKQRKAVEKFYEDEEGYIVTKTEYIYETASEDEKEAPEAAKVEEKVEKPKPFSKKSSASSENDISPQRGTKSKKGKKNTAPQNQPTLMNFFKKK